MTPRVLILEFIGVENPGETEGGVGGGDICQRRAKARDVGGRRGGWKLKGEGGVMGRGRKEERCHESREKMERENGREGV